MKVKFKKLNLGKYLAVPQYATEGSAGFDLMIDNFKKYYLGRDNKEVSFLREIREDYIYLHPGDRLLVGCGFSIAVPKGYMMDVRTRSGMALKQGLVVANSPGTIDEDYRGEVGVILINQSGIEIKLNIGDKIAQGVIIKYEKAEFEMVDDLDETDRGEGGFGSTGK